MSNRFDFLEIEPKGRLSRVRSTSAPAPLATAPPSAAAGPEALWKIVEVIGGPGTAVGEFASPGGLAVDGRGNLYVADSYNHRLQRISPQGDVAAVGRRGSRLGEFLNPQAVVVAPADGALFGARIYVLEQGNHRIQVFDAEGTPLAVWGGRGAASHQFDAPMGLALDPAGNLTIADTGNHRVVRWSARGKVLAVLDPVAMGAGPFGKPQGVCTDRAGRLYVADTLRHQVLLFDARLRFLERIGAPGAGTAEFAAPQDLAVDDAGNLFVVEAGAHRLQILDAAHRPLQQIDHAGKLGRFQAPAGIAIGREGTVYLADSGNHRVFRIAR